MDDEALKLAQALLNSGENEFLKEFTVNDKNNQPTGDTVVIIAKKKNADVYKSVAGPKGMICPACNGTGRI
jgi:hypothetical protein